MKKDQSRIESEAKAKARHTRGRVTSSTTIYSWRRRERRYQGSGVL